MAYMRLVTDSEMNSLYSLVKKLNALHSGPGSGLFSTSQSTTLNFKNSVFKAAFLFTCDEDHESEEQQPKGLLVFTELYRKASDIEAGAGFLLVPSGANRPEAEDLLPGIYLDEFYVEPELRGKGYGSLMIQWLCKWTLTQPQGYRHLTVMYQSGIGLERLYSHLGFHSLEPSSHLYELTDTKAIRAMRNTTIPTLLDNDVLMSVQSVSVTSPCEQILVRHPIDRTRFCTFLAQPSYCAWAGRTLWLSDFDGDESLISMGVLTAVIQRSVDQVSCPLVSVWVEYGGTEPTLLATLSALRLALLDSWNVVVMSELQMEMHADKYHLMGLLQHHQHHAAHSEESDQASTPSSTPSSSPPRHHL